MAKRKPNVSSHNVTSDLENNYSDSEDEFTVSSAKRKCRRKSSSEYAVSSTVPSASQNDRDRFEITEDNEHTYSCSPIFTRSCERNVNDSSRNRTIDRATRWKSILRNSCSSEDNKPSLENASIASDDESIPDLRNKSSRRKAKCISKNAINARKNRIRKKQYVNNLEDDIKSLETIKNDLLKELNSQSNEMDCLRNEVKYLRSVIANSSQIGFLLKKICSDNSQMQIRSSILNSQESATEVNNVKDMDDVFRCETPTKYMENCSEIQSEYGVCLHVANKRMSLEFCAACCESAANNWNSNILD